tara:strand:- start:2326 stop:2481 length:156 start_codon:yes stop_codon:yes gene_type:complete
MKRFHYIDKNEKEQLDLISLFEYATEYELDFDQVVIMLSKLNKYIKITEKF